MQLFGIFLVSLSICPSAFAFVTPQGCGMTNIAHRHQGSVGLCAESKTEQEKKQEATTSESGDDNINGQSRDVYLAQPTKDGYTLKQRLLEEIDSPFRKVRLAVFGASWGHSDVIWGNASSSWGYPE